MALPAGTRLGPYEIVAPAGAGGMGEVYEARDTRLHRVVAVKVLPAAITGDEAARARLLREARSVAALSHPNICTLHDIGDTADGDVFLVMERLYGETAQERLRSGPLDPGDVVAIGIALADALDTAHAAGIVHRDIKPANLFFTARGPKVLDFGVAQIRPAHSTSAGTALPDPPLTSPGAAVGTLAYMSPEQLRGDPLDARSDLFSLGLVLFELATGRAAFPGTTAAAIAAAILHDLPPVPSTVRPGLPARLDAVILKGLEKDRGRRYQSAAEMRADLQKLDRDPDAAAMVAPPTPRAAGPPRRWPAVAVVTALVVAGLAAWAVYQRRPAPLLTDTATLVLADFTNTTGDPVFDDTLRQGLGVQLQQSPFLSLVSDQRIRQTLRLMGQPGDAPLTADVAREICERLGGEAMLAGSIASLGRQYVVGLRAERCATGDVLAEEQVQAADKEHVLDALSLAASAFRTRVGESLTTVEQHDLPLEEASTASLDALKAFSAAVKTRNTGGLEAAMPLFQRAIEIDPGFALAHAQLGLHYSILGESELAARSTSEAYRLRDRASDPERFFITATYQRQVTGNLDAAQRTFETWGQMYPRDIVPPALSSGFVYKGTGDYDKAIAQATRALTIDPDFPAAHINLIFSHLYLGRFQEARLRLEQAIARGVAVPDFRLLRYLLAFVEGDSAAMDREVAAAGSDAEIDLLIQHADALTAARAGRLQRARAQSRRAAERTLQAGQRERAAVFQAGAAVWEAFYGNDDGARRAARAAVQLSRGRDVLFGAAFALAEVGDAAEAQALTDELARRLPEDTSVVTQYLPTLRGVIALQRGRPHEAVASLDTGVVNERGIPATNFIALFGSLYSAYVRGRAYQALERPADAVVEFQKILDHPGLVFSDPVGAMARLYLARALVAAGDRSKAAAVYEDLLTLWSGADADFGLARRVRAEAAANAARPAP